MKFEVNIPTPLRFSISKEEDWAIQNTGDELHFFRGLERVLELSFPNKRTLNQFLKNGRIELRRY